MFRFRLLLTLCALLGAMAAAPAFAAAPVAVFHGPFGPDQPHRAHCKLHGHTLQNPCPHVMAHKEAHSDGFGFRHDCGPLAHSGAPGVEASAHSSGAATCDCPLAASISLLKAHLLKTAPMAWMATQPPPPPPEVD